MNWNARLLEVLNPRSCLLSGTKAHLREIGAKPIIASSLTSDSGRPIIFIHGLEYLHPEEAIDEFVRPFEEGTAWFRNAGEHARCFTVSWNSLLDPSGRNRLFPATALVRRVLRFGLKLVHWGKMLAHLEARAQAAAAAVAPALYEILSAASSPPIIVTHSLGAYLWAEAARILATTYPPLPNGLGTWLSLQPALCWRAFETGQSLDHIRSLYTPESLIVWYSRADFILNTLYRGAKRTTPMGVAGSFGRHFHETDVTSLAQEAHGQAVLRRGSGAFLARVKSLLSTLELSLSPSLHIHAASAQP